MNIIHDIDEAIAIVRDGGVLIYPTDTAFGIGCRIDNTAAVDRVFSVRSRPRDKATPVLVSDKDMACEYFDEPSQRVVELMDTYWPGALTIVSACKVERIYSPVRGGGDTVGLRMPDHPTTLQLIREVGVPILGPSANVHGGVTPHRLEDIDPSFASHVDGVMAGACKHSVASTVVSIKDNTLTIIRKGAVTL